MENEKCYSTSAPDYTVMVLGVPVGTWVNYVDNKRQGVYEYYNVRLNSIGKLFLFPKAKNPISNWEKVTIDYRVGTIRFKKYGKREYVLRTFCDFDLALLPVRKLKENLDC